MTWRGTGFDDRHQPFFDKCLRKNMKYRVPVCKQSRRDGLRERERERVIEPRPRTVGTSSFWVCILVQGFLATSFEKRVANRFLRRKTGARVLWTVKVDPRGRDTYKYRCKHVNFVAHSLVAGEGTCADVCVYTIFHRRLCVLPC